MPITDARAWVELDLGALRANYDTLRRAAGSSALIPMVKANAYGLGVGAVVGALEPLGPWGYGVATVAEGLELRALGVTRPVLVVTPASPRELDAAAEARLTPAISSLDGLDAWSAAAGRAADAGGDPLSFHVEIDTGMGRSGFDWREVGGWAPAVASRIEGSGGRLRWSGVFTHFHSADEPDAAPSAAQWERFRDTLVQLPVRAEDLLVHAANSAAAFRWPEYAADAVRPGIFLYGGLPARDVPGLPEPAAVVAVRSRLALVRPKPAGSTAGYGATYAAAGPERWGTASIGYGDGLPRALAAGGEALVNGARVPVIGRISMDLTMLDVTAVPAARPGDVVTWIGTDGGERITVDEVAARVGTIGYEILTGLGRRMPRTERSG